jgi:hypothetical protein
MSAVPPNYVGPILQSGLTQREVSRVRDNDRAQADYAARRQSSASDEHDTTINTDDGDTQVDPDAEGTGSQGRAFTQGEEQPEPQEEQKQPADPFENEGQNIDLQA